MKRIKDLNPNTQTYWNGVYSGEANRVKYEKETFGPSGDSQRFFRVLEEIKNGDKVLDIGCGIGVLTRMIKDAYPAAEVWGTDIASSTIEDNTAQHPDITYKHLLIGEQGAVPTEYFDVVFSGEVLEHIEDPQQLFLDAYSYLKPGGKFIVTTPLLNRIASTEHIWSFEYSDIEQMSKETGFIDQHFVYLPNMEHYFVIFSIGTKA